MTAFGVLAVAALAQLAFLAALLVFLVDRRRRTRARHALVAGLRQEAQQHLRAWVAGGGPIDAFIASLARMPGDAALEYASELATSVLDPQSSEAMSAALRQQPWMQAIAAQATARQWWRRREAARALAILGTPADAPALRRLLADPHPAVAIIAIEAMPRVADEEMIGWALDRFPQAPTVARRLLISAVTQLRPLVERQLLRRLTAEAHPRSLARWITIAADLQIASALERIAQLDSHADSGVRRAVARALARRPNADSMAALRALIADASAEVRASAAWAMGQINSVAVLPHLRRAVHDSSWQVRYQAALALATLGEEGRAALKNLREDPDRYVADMAVMISGLSDGTLLELAAE